jgi:hypothetical protein
VSGHVDARSGGSDALPVPLVVRALALAVLVLIPVRILGQGFLPTDDALRHAGKAVSGKSWDQILVLRPDITVDSHPGWHALLGGLHRVAGMDAHALVLFSVIVLFVAATLAPAILLRRPEAWLLSLLVLAVADRAVLSRLVMGRPFLFTAGVLAVVLLRWPDFALPRSRRGILVVTTVLIAAATWIHASWYLFALPLLAFALAREWRAARRFALCLLAGVAIGAALTGQPLAFLLQTLVHPLLSLGGSDPQRTLAIEFQPAGGSPVLVLFLLGALALRALRGAWRTSAVDNPVFLLAVAGWILGFASIRFWADWGVPAAMVWLALELQDFLDSSTGARTSRRLAIAATAGAACFLAVTSDGASRWSRADPTYWPVVVPEAAPYLPEPGGILYSDEMRVFYELFYRQPKAPWRYQVGYEPGLMPPDDLKVYRQLLIARTTQAFAPWVEKMRPQDRLIIRSVGERPPAIEGLEWHRLGGDFWSGQKRP